MIHRRKEAHPETTACQQSSPVSLLLRMWRRRCARLMKGALSTALLLLSLFSLAAISTPDIEQLCEEQCTAESLITPPSANSLLFLQHIADHVIDPPVDDPPQPLSHDDVINPSWKHLGSWLHVVDYVMNIAHSFPNGTFVEVGAGDGELFSLSSYLEVVLGWRGLLVEPRKTEYDHARRRRKAAGANVCAAVTSYHSKRYFWEPRNKNLPDVWKKINSASSALAEFVTKEDIRDGETHLLQCFTLNALIHAYSRKVLLQPGPYITLVIIDLLHGVPEMIDSLKFVKIDMMLVRTTPLTDSILTEALEKIGMTHRPSLLMKSHMLFIDKHIKLVFKQAH